MPILRISDCPNLNAWDSKTPEAIASDWFSKFKDPRPSFEEANSPLEEMEAVAAFSLTNPGKLKAYHLLRTNWEELTSFGLQPCADAPGVTGIVSVDFRHWEICSERESVIRWIEHLQKCWIAGEERFRWVGLKIQQACLASFLALPDGVVTLEAKERCKRKLGEHEGGFSKRPRSKLEAELKATPPIIPENRIREKAYRAFLARGVGSRDHLADWFGAESELRDLYIKAFLDYSSPA